LAAGAAIFLLSFPGCVPASTVAEDASPELQPAKGAGIFTLSFSGGVLNSCFWGCLGCLQSIQDCLVHHPPSTTQSA
jgi:hypothetical protein